MATTTDFEPAQAWTGMQDFAPNTASERARSFALARRHTRLVRTLRWTLPGAAASLVALYAGILLQTIGWVSSLPKLDMPKIIPENLTMDNPRYEGFTNDGGAYVVMAKTAIQDLVNTDLVKLNGINGDLTDINKVKTNLKAAHGLYNSKSEQLELYDGIDIVSDDGTRAKLSRATILTKENIIISKEPVVVEMPSGSVRSNEMKMHNKSHEVAFIDNVQTHLIPPMPDPAAAAAKATTKAAPMISADNGPIDITANRLDIDDTGKTATFSGTVKAVQGGATMETAALEVHYLSAEPAAGAKAPPTSPMGGGKLKRILSKSPVAMTRAPADRVTSQSFDYDAVNEVAVLTGDVVMTSGVERRATSQQATIDQKADTVLLTGNVVAVQGRNSLKGERLFVDRTTGQTQLSSPAAAGQDAGRIATRFYRGEQNAAEMVKQKAKQAAAAASQGVMSAAGVFKTDPTAPIDVEALRLDVDDQKKLAVYRGDVRAVQGDFVVRTSEMRAHYTGAAGLADQLTPAEKKKDDAEVTRIEARGKVVVTSKNGQNATGDWADFDVKANQVVLGGDVILTQEKNVVRGTRLTIDMITGQSVIHSDPSQNDPGAAWSATAAPQGSPGPGFTTRPSTGGRPSAIFYPRKKKEESKSDTPAPVQPKKPSVGDGWAAENPSP